MPSLVRSLRTGLQEPMQKTQQCPTAKQRFVKKGVPVHQDTTPNFARVMAS